MRINQKFQNLVNQTIADHQAPYASARHGIIMSYDPMYHTATVLVSDKETDGQGKLFKNVPCPVMLGVQRVAPETGQFCWIAFESSNENSPLITHYYNYSYAEKDMDRQTSIKSGLPKFNLSI